MKSSRVNTRTVNRYDPFVVAISKSSMTVGHIPRKISSVCFLFLGKEAIFCRLTSGTS